MRLVFHIFRKDARRHWPEILLPLVLLAVFAWDQPRIWIGHTFEIRFVAGVANFLPALMILSWIFLIVRLVQGESLVGNRQFWITRPYVWYQLLAAKLLSVLLFIHIPLFIAQLVLLKAALFPVAASIPGLVYVHLLLFLALDLPCLTLSSITSGIGQASIALLIVLCPIIALLVLMNTVMPDMNFATDDTDGIQAACYLGTTISAILIQYIYRRTPLARLVVSGGCLLIFLVILLAPYERMIANDFPLPTQLHPLPANFSLDRNLSFAHTKGEQPNSYGDEVSLEIPFLVEGLSRTAIVQIRAVKLDLDRPEGRPWSSHWRSVYQQLSFGRTHTWPSLEMKKAVYNQMRNSHVRAHIALGLNVFDIGKASKITLSGGRLNLPNGGRCLNDLAESWLKCFAALKQPEPLLVVAELPSGVCPVSQEATSEPWAEAPAVYANLSADSSPNLDFTPVQQFDISLTRFYRFEDHEIRLPICPDTPLLVSTPTFRYSVRVEIDLGEVELPNYVPAYPRFVRPPHRAPASGEPSNNNTSRDFHPSPHTKRPV